MRTLRLPVGALLLALMLGAVLAVGASATPVAKAVATVECQGASATVTAQGARAAEESPDGLSLYMASNRPGSMELSPGVRRLRLNPDHGWSTP